MPRVTAPFEVDWRPDPPYDTREGATFASVTVGKTFTGPLEGQSEARLLGVKGSVEGSQAFVASERFEGAIEGHTGTVAFVHGGAIERGVPHSNWLAVVPDSGTGDLEGMTGGGEFVVEADGTHTFVLDYELPG